MVPSIPPHIAIRRERRAPMAKTGRNPLQISPIEDEKEWKTQYKLPVGSQA